MANCHRGVVPVRIFDSRRISLGEECYKVKAPLHCSDYRASLFPGKTCTSYKDKKGSLLIDVADEEANTLVVFQEPGKQVRRRAAPLHFPQDVGAVA